MPYKQMLNLDPLVSCLIPGFFDFAQIRAGPGLYLWRLPPYTPASQQ